MEINPKDRLVVVLRQENIDISAAEECTTRQAVWFPVIYVEAFNDCLEFKSEDSNQHGTINELRDDWAFQIQDLGRMLEKGIVVADTYGFCEIWPVECVEQFKMPKHLRVPTPEWEDV